MSAQNNTPSQQGPIDVHSHVILPGLGAAMAQRAPELVKAGDALEARRSGPESMETTGKMIGSRFPKLTQLDERLAEMDRQGVARQWVSPSPSHFYPWADQELARFAWQEAHKGLAEHIAGAPDRLDGLGLIPLQHPEQCVEAIEDAVLNHGFLGVEISSFADSHPDDPSYTDTVELSDPRLDPFWARAEELNAVVFLHPFGCSLDERLDSHYLTNTVGQPVENAVAISHLIFSGVLDRFPDLVIVAAHGGGYLPTAIGRSDRAWQVRPEARTCKRIPSSYLTHLYYDTVVHSPMQLRQLVEIVGIQQVVMGSDYPFDMGTEEPVRFVEQALGGSELVEFLTAHELAQQAKSTALNVKEGSNA
jgi:aminocarboxymuconate-semialdehyde decarboxylase